MLGTIFDGRVGISAIRKANEKRIGKKDKPPKNIRQNGEINISFSDGLITRKITITKEQISSAYRRALQKNAKKL